MATADYSRSEDDSHAGLTRRELLKRAMAVGVVVGAGGVGTVIEGLGRGTTAVAAPDLSKPKRGGTLLVGTTGGSAKDKLDAMCPICLKPDEARIVQLFEPLAIYDENFRVQNCLAEEISAKTADVWTIRVRQGVEFHNGKTLSADDVIYSLQRIINPNVVTQGKASLSSLDPKGMKKLDDRTVRLTLKIPDVTLPDSLAQYFNNIVPTGYNGTKPIGTGPFKSQSFEPGDRSTFVRNENYWRQGLPYIDAVTIIDLTDATALVDALLGGQLHAIQGVPYAQARVIQKNPQLKLLNSRSGFIIPITMRVDTPPFSDNNVREAFRWIADRPQMVQDALLGYGSVANDLFSPYDLSFDHALPERHQDIPLAKSLLKKAGKENLSVTLQTSAALPGLVEAAEVFAQQAKQAGVTVTVQNIDPSIYFGPNYLKYPFALDYFNPRNYLQQVEESMLPTSPLNETHWPDAEDRQYVSLYNEAKSTVNLTKRTQIIHDMQSMEWNRGGYVLWGYANFVDAYSAKVTGFHEDASLPLNRYGFDHVWFV